MFRWDRILEAAWPCSTYVPHGLQGNAELGKVVDNLLHHGPVLVAPSTLVVAESPVLLHGRETDGFSLVLLCHLSWSGAVKEVEIDASTQSSVGDVSGVENRFLAMSVSEVNTVAVRDVASIGAGIASQERQSTSLGVLLVVSGI